MNVSPEAIAKACCADLYRSEWARLILGDTLHPGGLALTHRLGKLMAIRRGDWVVDLASGLGSSALAVSRVFHCNVVGVEFGGAAVADARARSLEPPTTPQAFFLRGDAEIPPLQSSRFDAVFCECSMSLFPNKAQVVGEVGRMLSPGGRFGMSDVTVEPGSLPPELDGDMGRLLCLSDALSVAGYVGLIQACGLKLLYQEDASPTITSILDDLDSKLGAFLAWQRINGEVAPGLEGLGEGPRLIAELRELIVEGKLGYWLFVAEKPG